MYVLNWSPIQEPVLACLSTKCIVRAANLPNHAKYPETKSGCLVLPGQDPPWHLKVPFAKTLYRGHWHCRVAHSLSPCRRQCSYPPHYFQHWILREHRYWYTSSWWIRLYVWWRPYLPKLSHNGQWIDCQGQAIEWWRLDIGLWFWSWWFLLK